MPWAFESIPGRTGIILSCVLLAITGGLTYFTAQVAIASKCTGKDIVARRDKMRWIGIICMVVGIVLTIYYALAWAAPA